MTEKGCQEPHVTPEAASSWQPAAQPGLSYGRHGCRYFRRLSEEPELRRRRADVPVHP